MKNATHRVVILKNCNSELISQAIFFLKEKNNATDTGIMQEAERIVEKYMSGGCLLGEVTPNKKDPKKGDKLIKIVTALMIFLGALGAIFLLQ